MNTNVQEKRQLPKNVIHEGMLNSYEPNEMAKKFSSADYNIKHSNGDQIAFSYMNLEAKLYWLPKFMEFIQIAEYDGYVDQHIETLIYSLSEKSIVIEAQEMMSEVEKKEVSKFLKWISESHPELVNPHVTYAIFLWKEC